ncbi:hypothetical protein [Halostreptopolyspora alba]|uniref:Uncharacterized protein n=1 Tax=Halostreptopolyspora alba TaxID=2487137 RepID=A0A3N0E9G2_9ACTN|nr:hypothetical protein EFW17_12495 [Nocardiopsaceae bacterium YIM 96095]
MRSAGLQALFLAGVVVLTSCSVGSTVRHEWSEDEQWRPLDSDEELAVAERVAERETGGDAQDVSSSEGGGLVSLDTGVAMVDTDTEEVIWSYLTEDPIAEAWLTPLDRFTDVPGQYVVVAQEQSGWGEKTKFVTLKARGGQQVAEFSLAAEDVERWAVTHGELIGTAAEDVRAWSLRELYAEDLEERDNQETAEDREPGEELWHEPLPNGCAWDPEPVTEPGDTLLTTQRLVVMGHTCGSGQDSEPELLAFDSATGDQEWRHSWQEGATPALLRVDPFGLPGDEPHAASAIARGELGEDYIQSDLRGRDSDTGMWSNHPHLEDHVPPPAETGNTAPDYVVVSHGETFVHDVGLHIGRHLLNHGVIDPETIEEPSNYEEETLVTENNEKTLPQSKAAWPLDSTRDLAGWVWAEVSEEFD